jgi:hyaluronoglucosaminidase
MPAQARAAADRTPATRPGTATAYVVNAGSGTVTPIATATNRAGPAIKVGDNPHAIAITPDGRTLYAANWGEPGMVTPIATAGKKPGHAVRTGIYPDAMVITPDGRTAYVANLGSNTVTPISTATNKAGPAIRTGKTPFAIAITP